MGLHAPAKRFIHTTMSEHLPNMGRPAGTHEPPGVEHLYRDTAAALPVLLLTWDDPAAPLPARHRHWAIAWHVGVASSGDGVYRQLAVVRENGPRGLLAHLTNWGPKTKIVCERTRSVVIQTLGYQQRLWLERVAAAEPVVPPNGMWNGQDWIVSVLVKAVREGVVDREKVRLVLAQAGWTVPLPV
ncbi:hypothetical protein H0H81_006385 [Sphagnurus paluster]|uniref:Uncharacterized protein n=1 Tax=Sphagnurus paluster TaxID=117069 RepID=A0A9P7FV90_9AGAR|nr:hypothetical protein H0H81_006385 [Sphagnurus paluster]